MGSAAPARAARLPAANDPVAFPEIPLTDLHLARIELLEQLLGPGRYLGWAITGAGARRIDIAGGRAFFGPTLHIALGEAIRWAKGLRS